VIATSLQRISMARKFSTLVPYLLAKPHIEPLLTLLYPHTLNNLRNLHTPYYQ